MNWFEKIKAITSQEDTSPELKKGGIKSILITIVKKNLPDFPFMAYKSSCYIFERIRTAGGLEIHETLHISFSLSNRNFSCSIASRLNPKYIYSNSYNSSLINPHIDLLVLKKGTGVIPIEEAYYFHNGKVNSTTKVVEEIFKDFKIYGLPFLDKNLEAFKTSPTIKAGIHFIENLACDKAELKEAITKSMAQNRFSAIHNSTFDELKQIMYSTLEGRMREVRDKVPNSAFELLELYWEKEK
ncbi:hypothetical protein [Rufibacter aurantiacus]|uniref:hypothetical protein n=1 Tax=Rufibacter aurantiacus TaxID=2817374 RepID=UPI001B30C883|nr:hypothetical protein [Rufibacter aurantiacus]